MGTSKPGVKPVTLSASTSFPPVATATAPVQEVFSSVQGEAVYVGKRQIFVRFAHCHLKCAYCDTPMTTPTGQCHVESVPGSGQTDLLPNPFTPERLLEVLNGLLPQAHHHSISFTGGEPLLYHRFLREVFPHVPVKTYLETSGTQADFLSEVLPWTDIIAMDIKLPSATREAAQFENHRAFYEVARSRPETELFIKLIFNNQTSEEELEAVRAIVSDKSLPLILQPETSLETQHVTVNPANIFRVEQWLSRHFEDVRVIPQTHKMMRVL